MAPDVFLYDTTARDGDQDPRKPRLGVKDKIALARLADDAHFAFFEGGFAGANETDNAVFQALRDAPLKHALLCAFGKTMNPKNTSPEDDPLMVALLETQAQGITVVGKSSRFQVQEALRTTPENNLRVIEASTKFLRQRGLRTVVYDAEHFFDAWKEDQSYALDTLHAAVTGGAGALVLCDTNGGTFSWEVPDIVGRVREEFDGVLLGIHAHNDASQATAISLEAVRAGAQMVQGTWNGIGERAGNTDNVAVAANLYRMGRAPLPQEEIRKLTQHSRTAALITKIPLGDTHPFSGKLAFHHTGGMHTSAMERNTRTYEMMDPGEIGNQRGLTVAADQMGKASIREVIRHTRLLDETLKQRILTDATLQGQVMIAIAAREKRGYSYDHTADASLELVILEACGDLERVLKIEDAEVHSRLRLEQAGMNGNGDNSRNTRAFVKAKVNGDAEPVLDVAEDEGPIGALNSALLKAMMGKFPEEAGALELLDYRMNDNVRAEEGAHAPVEVVAEFRDGDELFVTRGVSRNSILAGWQCVVDAHEYVLQKRKRQKATLLPEREPVQH